MPYPYRCATHDFPTVREGSHAESAKLGTLTLSVVPNRSTHAIATLRASQHVANYGMCTPEAARAMTSRWISEVPSKSV